MKKRTNTTQLPFHTTRITEVQATPNSLGGAPSKNCTRGRHGQLWRPLLPVCLLIDAVVRVLQFDLMEISHGLVSWPSDSRKVNQVTSLWRLWGVSSKEIFMLIFAIYLKTAMTQHMTVNSKVVALILIWGNDLFLRSGIKAKSSVEFHEWKQNGGQIA